MNKQFKRFRRNKKADPYEKAAESIFLSYFVIIVVGENFSLVSGNQVLSDVVSNCKAYSEAELTLKDLNNPQWITKDGDLFYGVWGQVLNRFQRMRMNDCYPMMLGWRNALFKEEDERFMDDKSVASKLKGTPDEGRSSSALGSIARSKRFFYLTSNMDGDVEKVGFLPTEFYETKGNIVSWQCAQPCSKQFWRIDDEFRFEVLENGRAPPIKYVEAPNIKKKRETMLSNSASSASTSGFVGDVEDFNFYDPHGRFHYDQLANDYNEYNTNPREGSNSRFVTTPRTGKSIAKRTKNFLSHHLLEKRAMYFRYFLPDVADQVRNPEQYYRPSARINFSSIHGSNGVLHPLSAIESLTSTKGNVKHATLFRHNIFSSSESGHNELHHYLFSGMLDPVDQGVVEVQILDPLIQHISFYSKNLNEELVILENERESYLEKFNTQPKRKEDLLDDLIVPGSDSLFSFSVQIIDSDGVPHLKYQYENIGPRIRKRRENTGLYVDSMIVNVQESQGGVPTASHVLPYAGYISLVVEPLRLRGKDIAREFITPDDKPWQICGQYMVEHVSRPVLDSDQIDPNTAGQLIDFILNANDSLHRLRIRAIQYDIDGRIEVVTLFIDMPITNYVKTTYAPAMHSSTTTPSVSGRSTSTSHHHPAAHRASQSRSGERDKIEQELRQKESKVPVMNRQFCNQCRGLARPRVKMFEDKAFIPGSSTRYRAWCADVKKAMTAEPDKKLTIVEFGAEAAVRNQSETLLKQTQIYGASLIRINPVVKETKKGRDMTSVTPKGINSEDAFQLIEDDSSIGAIQKIDAYLRGICEKFAIVIE